MKPKKSNLKSNLKRVAKLGEQLSGVKLSSDPKRAGLELKMQGIVARVKKEGLTSA